MIDIRLALQWLDNKIMHILHSIFADDGRRNYKDLHDKL